MILGMPVSAFILLHVALSLAGIFTGCIVSAGLLASRRLPMWTAAFFATTLLTSLTDFLFPVPGLDPARVVGLISLAVLAAALLALYGLRHMGPWRWIYVLSALLAFYLNVFVAVVQAFEKISALRVLAPTQKEPPFQVAQLLVLAAFILLGVLGLRRFHPQTA